MLTFTQHVLIGRSQCLPLSGAQRIYRKSLTVTLPLHCAAAHFSGVFSSSHNYHCACSSIVTFLLYAMLRPRYTGCPTSSVSWALRFDQADAALSQHLHRGTDVTSTWMAQLSNAITSISEKHNGKRKWLSPHTHEGKDGYHNYDHVRLKPHTSACLAPSDGLLHPTAFCLHPQPCVLISFKLHVLAQFNS